MFMTPNTIQEKEATKHRTPMKMPASIKKKRESTQCKNLRNVYQFKDEDKNDAIKSVQRISEFALETALMAESHPINEG